MTEPWEDQHLLALHRTPTREILAIQRERSEFRSLVEQPWKTIRRQRRQIFTLVFLALIQLAALLILWFTRN